MTRRTILVLPKLWQTANWTDAWSRATFQANANQLKIDLDQARSILLRSAN